ncbi:MAG: hypothetical protein ABEI57_02205 [Halapricum sp.]
MEHTTIIDKALLTLSSALVLLGVVVLGLVEVISGEPYGAAPVTNDAGKVIASPTVDPVLRTGIVILGLVVLFAWFVYRAWVTPRTETSEEALSSPSEQMAD